MTAPRSTLHTIIQDLMTLLYNIFKKGDSYMTEDGMLTSQIQEINIRENRRDNQEWAIQRHRQQWMHKPQDKDKQNNKTEN